MEALVSLSGILFVILLAVSFTLPTQPPQSGESPQKIIDFFKNHRLQFFIALYLQGLALIPFFAFSVRLRDLLRCAEGGKSLFASVSFASAVASGALALAISPFWATLAYRIGDQSDPGVVRVLFDLGNLGFNVVSFPFTGFIAAASVVMIRAGIPARWLGWAGIPVAFLQLVSAGSFAEAGIFAPGGFIFLVGFFFWALWIVATSILMYKESRYRKT
jgi:hypothetical protein